MKWYILKRYMSHNSTVWKENMSPNVFVSVKKRHKTYCLQNNTAKKHINIVHPLSVCRSVYPSLHMSVHLSVHPSVLSVHPSCLSIRPSVHPSVHLSCLSIRPSIRLSVNLSIRQSTRLSVLSVHPLSVCQWVSATVYYSICQSIR
jgi:hypothetical protein